MTPPQSPDFNPDATAAQRQGSAARRQYAMNTPEKPSAGSLHPACSATDRNVELAISTMNRRIDEFSELQKGWDSYGAEPINESTRRLAKQLTEVLPAGKGGWIVVPCIDGSITFESNASVITVWSESPNDKLRPVETQPYD